MRTATLCRSIIALMLIGVLGISVAQAAHVRGWVEHARVMPNGLLMAAKLDSGAQTTSIHAEIIAAGQIQEDAGAPNLLAEPVDTAVDINDLMRVQMAADGTLDDPPSFEPVPIADLSSDVKLPEMVKFRLTSRGGRTAVYSAQVVRWVSIRRRGGGSIVRPVVLMDLCVAGVRVRGEVNLADRTGFNYPVLIGRNMLSDAAISVDSGRRYASKRACPQTD